MLPGLAHAQVDRYDALANSPMNENRPTPETSKLLREELLFQRATQTYLWALPLINTLGMKTGSEKTFGAGYNVLPVWKKRLDAKTLVTTPNSDVIYAMSYLDLGKDGAMVFEAAPGLQGILLDFWQRPIPGSTLKGRSFAGDVGLPGPDEGKGGKFLILPPGYKGAVSPGYFVYRSDTRIWFFTDYYSISPGMHDLSDTGQRCQVYGCLHRQHRHAPVRWRELPREIAAQHPGRELLVLDTLRGRECFGAGQRTAISLARLAGQAGARCRRQRRNLPRSSGTCRQAGELAGNGIRQRILRRPLAVRSYRGGDQELEAGRHRTREVSPLSRP